MNKKLVFIMMILIISVSCKSQNFFASHTHMDLVKYGYLYNFYAVDFTTGDTIASSGWEVPTLADYTTLRDLLGGQSVAGDSLKESGNLFWNPTNNGVNSSRFNGRGAGVRNSTVFQLLKTQAYFRTSDGQQSLSRLDNSSTLFVVANFSGTSAIDGRSVRLIKTTTSLSNGETGTYTGNDGRVYRTICIGTQEWLADNLAETQFRSGNYITGFDGGVYTPISTANWAAKTTEAMCAYGDNLFNVLK